MKARIHVGILSLLLVSIGLASPSLAQNQGNSPMSEQQAREQCQEMLAKHQEMQQEMAAMDARLEELVQAMNNANGEERIEAMTTVINEMVAQRQDMHDMMAEMGPGMMGHMMMHMHPEMMENGVCPMMQRQHPRGGPPGQMRQDR